MIRYVKILIASLLLFSSSLYAQKENGTDTIENVGIKNNLKGSVVYNAGATLKIGSITDKYELFEDDPQPMFEISTGTYYSLFLSLGVEYYCTNNFSIECAVGLYNSKVVSKFDIYLPIANDKEVQTAHKIDLNLLGCGLAFLGKYRLFSDFQMFGGVRFGLNLSTSYDHAVTILSDEAIYSDGSKSRLFKNQEIRNPQGHFTTILGASYIMNLEENKHNLTFSLSYENGFNVLENSSRLKFYSFNLGVAFNY
jgi:hypothetical protein